MGFSDFNQPTDQPESPENRLCRDISSYPAHWIIFARRKNSRQKRDCLDVFIADYGNLPYSIDMTFFIIARLSMPWVWLQRTAAILGTITILFSINPLVHAKEPWQNWQNPPPVGDKLVAKVWSMSEQGFITPQKLAAQLANSNYVLIGEVHDNIDHHRLQAWLIEQITARAKPAIVMEMISSGKSQILDKYLSGPDAEPAGLGPALDWANSGWPDWTYYQPIAEIAMRSGLPILPGDPDRPLIREIARQGIDSLEKAEQQLLALDSPLSAVLDKALVEDIKDSHCNLLPQAMIGPMVQVQRFRDAKLARAVVDADTQGNAGDRTGGVGRVILIAGNGHVRNDRGVPWYLIRQQPKATISSVMLLEINSETPNFEELIITDPQGRPAADYFWFTPQAKRQDQCEKLRQRFKK
ncbi:MAG: ChaN family lipoprotein [Hyphomicrobiales bacterium]|nr:ChaN family lipoprotein [Hyphomicrobiales bacterium]